MNRDEKNKQTKNKIISSAIEEFGSKNYGEASMNSICKRGGISKGIIYHYFRDKDELYLLCVKECIDAFTDYLVSNVHEFHDYEQDMRKYIELRSKFFGENPYYRNIFFYSLFQKPIHLDKEIKKIREKLDKFNVDYCKASLRTVKLRKDITMEDAVECFLFVQESYNAYFENKDNVATNFDNMIEEHELKITKIFKIMLHGIAKE